MSSEFHFQADESVFNHPFTIVYNDLIESNVSPEGFRLITYMLSKPKGWVFHDYKLMEVCQCKDSKFKQVVREMKTLGYMQTVSIPSGLGDGKFTGSKRLFSNRPIFKNTERLDFNPSVKEPPTDRMVNREYDLPTVGETTPQVSNTERVINTKSSSKTLARAPASLNTKEIEQAKAAVAVFVEGAEKKGHGEFVYTPSTEQLVLDLGRIDISNDRAQRLIHSKGEERVREAMEYAIAKARTNPGGYFEKTLAAEWGKGWKEKKEAPKEEDLNAARRNQQAEVERKRKEQAKALENIRSAPKTIQAHSGAMSDLAKMLPSLARSLRNREKVAAQQ